MKTLKVGARYIPQDTQIREIVRVHTWRRDLWVDYRSGAGDGIHSVKAEVFRRQLKPI